LNSDIISRYFPDISPAQKAQFQKLEGLYKEWNVKINVISRKDIEELYVKHVLHSLGIAKVAHFAENTTILDVGTGGGFPGIPLAILFPEAQFHLVDSIGKKITVVQEIAQRLNLSNVKAEKARAEDLPHKYDFVVSRAVTRMAEFYSWVNGKINKSPSWERRDSSLIEKNGILYLKGGDLKEELSEAKTKYAIFNLSDFFEEDFFETKKVVYIPM
jgi:16S rRNA (guanine527-N7)-methyltransferase